MSNQLQFRRSALVRPLSLVFLSICIVASVTALAADPATEPATEPATKAEIEQVEGQVAPEVTVAEREARDLLRDLTIQRNVEIETALATVRMKVEQLQTSLATTSSPSERLALQRATEAAKIASQIEVLRIQARYADLAGKPELATQIREEAGQMEQVAADRSQAIRR